jgi:hypothetical protein
VITRAGRLTARTEPVDIPGLAGPLALDTNVVSGRFAISVGGRPAVRVRRRRVDLPTADSRTVRAVLRPARGTEVYPTLEIGGTRYRIGPRVPVLLWLLVALPLPASMVTGLVLYNRIGHPLGALVAGLGGTVIGLAGGVGVWVNRGLVQSWLPRLVVAPLMLVMLAAATAAAVGVDAVLAALSG